ncbi:MAG: helix-turn-helix transcriptional regulator [Gordonia sp. (in: high G+C Gram-positive bacteria)]
MDDPEVPAEAQLIRRARTRISPKLSIRAAAASVGLSEARWRQIESGYQTVRAGERSIVIAPAPTLAAMAHALNITPAQLRDAGREDAADALASLPAADDELALAAGRVREGRNDIAHGDGSLAAYTTGVLEQVDEILDAVAQPEGASAYVPSSAAGELLRAVEMIIGNIARSSAQLTQGEDFAHLQDLIRNLTRKQTMIQIRRGLGSGIGQGQTRPQTEAKLEVVTDLSWLADGEQRRPDSDVAARTRRPGTEPENDGGEGVGEESQVNAAYDEYWS